jgi:hypothetical protein
MRPARKAHGHGSRPQIAAEASTSRPQTRLDRVMMANSGPHPQAAASAVVEPRSGCNFPTKMDFQQSLKEADFDCCSESCAQPCEAGDDCNRPAPCYDENCHADICDDEDCTATACTDEKCADRAYDIPCFSADCLGRTAVYPHARPQGCPDGDCQGVVPLLSGTMAFQYCEGLDGTSSSSSNAAHLPHSFYQPYQQWLQTQGQPQAQALTEDLSYIVDPEYWTHLELDGVQELSAATSFHPSMLEAPVGFTNPQHAHTAPEHTAPSLESPFPPPRSPISGRGSGSSFDDRHMRRRPISEEPASAPSRAPKRKKASSTLPNPKAHQPRKYHTTCMWVLNPYEPAIDWKICNAPHKTAKELDEHIEKCHVRLPKGKKGPKKHICMWYGCEGFAVLHDYAHKGKLMRHTQGHHTGHKHFECGMEKDDGTFCEKTFVTKEQLDNHRTVHTKEKPYKCPLRNKKEPEKWCKLECATRTQLNTHIRWHMNDKKYVCPYCPHASSDSSNLSKHMKNKHPDKPPRGRMRKPATPPFPSPTVQLLAYPSSGENTSGTEFFSSPSYMGSMADHQPAMHSPHVFQNGGLAIPGQAGFDPLAHEQNLTAQAVEALNAFTLGPAEQSPFPFTFTGNGPHWSNPNEQNGDDTSLFDSSMFNSSMFANNPPY